MLAFGERSEGGVSISDSFILCNSFQLLTAHLQPLATNSTRWRCLFLVGNLSPMHINPEKVLLLNLDIGICMR